MLEFIAKYWLEFAFGLITLGMGFVARHYYKLIKDGRTLHKKESEEERDQKTAIAINELKKEFTADIQQRKAENARQDEEMAAIKAGILALWKKVVLEQGKMLLKDDHIITTDEYLSFSQDHDVYNKLGGNHEGDQLFKMVTQKYNSGLLNK